mmetsp:Transcript_12234/g.22207  ORF Transcript_12234/g.22207 Transcript_12234/m.22207 type:complete len:208 (-) Transcript_12234:107-730(-)
MSSSGTYDASFTRRIPSSVKSLFNSRSDSESSESLEMVATNLLLFRAPGFLGLFFFFDFLFCRFLLFCPTVFSVIESSSSMDALPRHSRHHLRTRADSPLTAPTSMRPEPHAPGMPISSAYSLAAFIPRADIVCVALVFDDETIASMLALSSWVAGRSEALETRSVSNEESAGASLAVVEEETLPRTSRIPGPIFVGVAKLLGFALL